MGGDAPVRGHRQALDELREIMEADPSVLEILGTGKATPSGWLRILISLGTAGVGTESHATGTGPRARIRARERFEIAIPRDFPFDYPRVSVPHGRFAGLPHVQWGRQLCLYVSPTTEWQPSDGMFGFLERLLLWVERAAAGTLDPAGEPVHPPVVYESREAGAVVVRTDTPQVGDAPWLGFAVLRTASSARVDLVGWLEFADTWRLLVESPAEVLDNFARGEEGVVDLQLGLVVLLPEAWQSEYPGEAKALIKMLARRGIGEESLIVRLALLAHLNARLASAARAGDPREVPSPPSYIVVGTPMRGIAGGERRQHLTAWRLPPIGQQIVRLMGNLFSDVPELASIGDQASDLLREWLETAELDWARVYEERPEVTTRRDSGSPLGWVRGRRVLILGCGAIGAHAAEHLSRAGVARLVLVDRARVSPGVLVRQPYDDADIHRPKAEALTERLRRIRPDLELEAVVGDALATVLGDPAALSATDLIIDAAANPAVTAFLERRRRDRIVAVPPILSLMLGHMASRGVATVAPTGYSGGGADLTRKVKLAALTSADLRAFADDFFPNPPRSDYFQPEPGCSEATFVGSDTEVAALTATLLAHALSLCGPLSDPTAGGAVLVDLGLDGRSTPVTRRLLWPSDIVCRDEEDGREVRISATALAEMRAECRLMARRRGPQAETGGILLGEVDDACGVVWASVASGPPPDSRASPRAFVCGVEGVEEFVARHDTTSRGALRFLGIWHSHPAGGVAPSLVDDEGMRELVMPVARAPRRALLLIVGGPPERWGDWLRRPGGNGDPAPPHIFARLRCRPRATEAARSPRNALRYAQALVEAGHTETRRWRPTPSASPRGRKWHWFYRGQRNEA